MKKTTLIIVATIAIICIAALIFSGYIGQKEGIPNREDLLLSNYPKLFEKDVVIVIGENTTQIEYEGAEAIAENLLDITGNMPVIKSDAELTEDDKEKYNLILVGRPNVNRALEEVYKITDATRITKEYPGENKGILEILRNPWNEDKAMLLVEGSDEWGVKVGDLILKENKKLENKAKLFVDWVEYTGVGFPIDSSEEAIRYAKTDSDVNVFIREWSANGFKIGTWAEWDPVYNVWEVGISPGNDIRDVLFLLHIKPNGTIVEKRIVPTA